MVSHLDVFRQEAAELLDGLEGELMALEVDPADAERVDAVFRTMHTLKGSGGMFGFSALVRFVHGLENAYDMVRDGRAKVTPALIETSLAARDHIQQLLEVSGDSAAEEALEQSDTAQKLAAQITAFTGGENEAPETAQAAASPGPKNETFHIRFTPDPGSLRNGMRPDLLVDELIECGSGTVALVTDAVPDLDTLAPTACHLGWELVLTTDRGREALDAIFVFSEPEEVQIERVDTEQTDAPTTWEVFETAPEAVAAQPSAAPPQSQSKDAPAPPAKPAQKAGSLRVQARRLDDLMDQLGELVIAQSRLNRLSEQIADLSLSSAAEEIERLVTGLRDTTLSIRMLPIELVFGKFRRVVRDLSGELGKSVALETTGGETEVDKNVIDSLTEPLVHIIRNSIDHGIEAPEDREAAGKPATAQLRLSAHQAAGEVLISIRDDGAGLNLPAIRNRAVERGLLSPDDQPSDAELSQMIFRPGFSTAKTVSTVSGRGVGMDAVRRVIEDLRGSVDVVTEAGQGTTVTLRLPLTLAIIDGLMVRVAGSVFVIPLSSVVECVELDAAAARRESGRTVLNIREELVPYVDLSERFGLQGHEAVAHPRVVIVGTESRRIGLVVDDILGQHQTVIKSLSVYHRAIKGFSGATILGDGTVALILDIAAFVKLLSGDVRAAA
ncbi:MAG: chemotaxis protein CheA [Pseudomonadota bacterium]